MCCRGVQGLANLPFLGRFLCSALLSVAPYCVPGGIRVVSSCCGRASVKLGSTLATADYVGASVLRYLHLPESQLLVHKLITSIIFSGYKTPSCSLQDLRRRRWWAASRTG